MNSQYFSKEDVETGLLTSFIEELLKGCYSSEAHFNDIHIIPEDLGAFRVEWIQSLWESKYNFSKFVELKPEELVVHAVVLPDNSIQYVENIEEETNIWKCWQAEHPEWHKE